jgi:hypothetical protein
VSWRDGSLSVRAIRRGKFGPAFAFVSSHIEQLDMICDGQMWSEKTDRREMQGAL